MRLAGRRRLLDALVRLAVGVPRPKAPYFAVPPRSASARPTVATATSAAPPVGALPASAADAPPALASSPASEIRRLLSGRGALQAAFVLADVLGPPAALREAPGPAAHPLTPPARAERYSD